MANDKCFALEDLEAAGYEIGLMVAAIVRGALRGLADYETVERDKPGDDPPAYEEQPPTPRAKTRIEDCRACWCNTCANIEGCIDANDDAQAGALRDYPCDGCTNGIRYMPRQDDEKCPCTGYVQGGSENNG